MWQVKEQAMPPGFPPDQFHPKKLDQALAPYAARPNPNRQVPATPAPAPAPGPAPRMTEEQKRAPLAPAERDRIIRQEHNQRMQRQGMSPTGERLNPPAAPKPAPPEYIPTLPQDYKSPVNPNNPPLPKDWKPSRPQTPPSIPPGPESTPISRYRRGPMSQAGGFTQTEDGTYATGTNIRLPRNMQEMQQQFGQQFPGIQAFRQQPTQPPAGQNPSDFMSGQPSMEPGQQVDMTMMPTRQQQMPQQMTQSQAPYNPLQPIGPNNMPPAPTQQDVDRLNFEAQGGRFGAIDRQSGGGKDFTEMAYRKEEENLRKAAQNVLNDPRFSDEQRQQALDRIAQRAQEMQQNFAAGKAFDQSTFGIDRPPEEQFADVQSVGLEPVGGNAIRNPETGDVMRAMRGPNGMLIPVTADQVEIDSLPDGTQYMDPNTGKIETVGGKGRGGGSSRGSSAGQASSTEESQQTPEQLYASYEKWSKKIDEGSTAEEQRAILDAAAGVTDPERRSMIEAMAKSDPMSALAELQSENIPVDLDSARMQAFKREQDAKAGRQKALGEMFGISQPEEGKTAVDTNRYRIRQGTYGSSVIRRRGGSVDIPAVRGPDGKMVAAPNATKQLADLETDTPFQNITRQRDGKEVRMLPFEMESVDLQDFSLPDNVRQAFSGELGRIRARNPEEWQEFSDTLQKYQTVDEEWDPTNPSDKQKALMKVVGSFYGELNTSGKALMSMYVAHALGYKVDVDPENPDNARGFQSTGFARDESKGSRVAQAGITKQSYIGMRDAINKSTTRGFVDAVAKVPKQGEQPSQEFYRSVNGVVETILNQVIDEETDLNNKVGLYGPGGDQEGVEPGTGPGKWNRWNRINTLFADMVNEAMPANASQEDRDRVMQEIQTRINTWARENPDKRFGEYQSTAYNESIGKPRKSSQPKFETLAMIEARQKDAKQASAARPLAEGEAQR